jgi:hypothetical protein
MNPLNNSSATTIQNQIHEHEKNQPAIEHDQKENAIANLTKLSKSHINANVKSDAIKNINDEIKKTNYDEIITFQHLLNNKPKINDDILRFGSNEQNALYKGLSPNAKQYAKNYGLSRVEAVAIRAYTQDGFYIHINNQFRTLDLEHIDISDVNALKKAGVKKSDLAELIAALITGLRKLPPAQTSETYFKSLGRNVDLPLNELKLYIQDAEVVAPTFLSTTNSAEEMVTDNWWDNKDHALFIHQKINGNGRDISMFSDFKNEEEILFLPFTKFKVMFRGEPTLTTPGISSFGEPSNNEQIKKILISLQEI